MTKDRSTPATPLSATSPGNAERPVDDAPTSGPSGAGGSAGTSETVGWNAVFRAFNGDRSTPAVRESGDASAPSAGTLSAEDAELCQKLRDWGAPNHRPQTLVERAAARIEQLYRENESLSKILLQRAEQAEARAEALEKALREIRDYTCGNEGNLFGMNYLGLVRMLNAALAASAAGKEGEKS